MKTVKIYSTPTCIYCVYAKNLFNKLNIPFEDIDLSKNHSKIEEMFQKTGQMGVPVIEIGEKVFVGYRPEEFLAELNK